MSAFFDSEDSAKTREKKLQAFIAETNSSEEERLFMMFFVYSFLLPIVPLAFIVWAPLWSKWKLPGVLGVLSAWGGTLILAMVTINFFY
mgnify:CR=1 FL=1|jgi:hypothetical protein